MVMAITCHAATDTNDGRIDLTLCPEKEDGSAFAGGLAPGEWGLPLLRWTGHAGAYREDGLTGFMLSTVTALRFGLAQVQAVEPIMRRADRLIAQAVETSEDDSFASVASTLAAHFRATTVRVTWLNGETTTHKRGAVYVMANRAAEALIATVPAKPAEEIRQAA